MTIGSVDAGKSSLISVLVYKALDDGRGVSHVKEFFRHPHKIESGRTSAISSHHLEKDSGVVTFVDLAGHERYLKTTITGLSSFADYAIVTIGANMGVLRMTKEHLGIALALKIPIIVVITRK